MIESDVQLLSPGTIVDLFELDASNIEGGSIFRWHNDVNELGNDVTWQGNIYSRFPVEAGGFDKTSTGELPRPILQVSNVTGAMGALAGSLRDFLGATVTRKRTFVKYLDAVNFAGGNPQADPAVGFVDEIWIIDRKAGENGIFMEFELAAAFDLAGVRLPARQVIRNICTWAYRSAECSYTGPAVADALDTPTGDLALDKCSHRINGCALRFGENAVLPFGAFPGVGRV